MWQLLLKRKKGRSETIKFYPMIQRHNCQKRRFTKIKKKEIWNEKLTFTKFKDLTFRCCIHICYGLGLWNIILIIKCCGWLGWLNICVSGRCSYILGGLIASNLVNTQTGMRTNQKCTKKICLLVVFFFVVEFGICQAKNK